MQIHPAAWDPGLAEEADAAAHPTASERMRGPRFKVRDTNKAINALGEAHPLADLPNFVTGGDDLPLIDRRLKEAP